MTSTRKGEAGVKLRWTHVDGGDGSNHINLKIESTDAILSSSHVKKLVSIKPEFCLSTE